MQSTDGLYALFRVARSGLSQPTAHGRVRVLAVSPVSGRSNCEWLNGRSSMVRRIQYDPSATLTVMNCSPRSSRTCWPSHRRRGACRGGHGTSAAHRCMNSGAGRVVVRHSCSSPWRSSARHRTVAHGRASGCNRIAGLPRRHALASETGPCGHLSRSVARRRECARSQPAP